MENYAETVVRAIVEQNPALKVLEMFFDDCLRIGASREEKAFAALSKIFKAIAALKSPEGKAELKAALLEYYDAGKREGMHSAATVVMKQLAGAVDPKYGSDEWWDSAMAKYMAGVKEPAERRAIQDDGGAD